METLIVFAVALLSIFISLVIIFVVVPLVFLFGASYEGSRDEVVQEIVRLARMKSGEKVVDLGSGDGRFVLAFARQGIEAHGYETNPLLVLFSRWCIRREHLQDKAFVHWQNFWHVDLRNFNVAVVFQVGYVMQRLGEKLRIELKKGSRVISHRWKIPSWKLRVNREVGAGIYLYTV